MCRVNWTEQCQTEEAMSLSPAPPPKPAFATTSEIYPVGDTIEQRPEEEIPVLSPKKLERGQWEETTGTIHYLAF